MTASWGTVPDDLVVASFAYLDALESLGQLAMFRRVGA